LDRELVHGLHDRAQPEPPLVFSTLETRFNQAGEIVDAGKLDLATFQADHGRGRHRVVNLRKDEFYTLGSQAGSLDAIEGRGVAALLDMSQDCLANIENPSAFLFEER